MGTPFGWGELARKLRAHSGTILYVGGTAIASLTALGIAFTGTVTSSGNVTTTAGSIIVQPSTIATGFDAHLGYTMDAHAEGPCWDASPIDGGAAAGCVDGAPAVSIDAGFAPDPVVEAGDVRLVESVWDTDAKASTPVGWRLKLSSTSAASPVASLLVQSSVNGTEWTTRATLNMAGLLTLTGDIASAASAASLWNTTVATINIGGAASTINIGPGSNTATSTNFGGGSGATGCSTDGTYGGMSCTDAFRTTAGTVNSAGFSFISDANTGMYRIGADNLGFAANGSLEMSISTTAVDIAGGSGSTGCTVTGSTGALACTSTITAGGGSTGHGSCWKGSVLSYCESALDAAGLCTCH